MHISYIYIYTYTATDLYIIQLLDIHFTSKERAQNKKKNIKELGFAQTFGSRSVVRCLGLPASDSPKTILNLGFRV